MPPCPKQIVSQDFLSQHFNDENWEGKLSACRSIEFHNRPASVESGQVPGTCRIGTKYYDHENNLVAIVFIYRKPDGTLGASGKPSPKGLLIDGTWCYVNV